MGTCHWDAKARLGFFLHRWFLSWLHDWILDLVHDQATTLYPVVIVFGMRVLCNKHRVMSLLTTQSCASPSKTIVAGCVKSANPVMASCTDVPTLVPADHACSDAWLTGWPLNLTHSKLFIQLQPPSACITHCACFFCTDSFVHLPDLTKGMPLQATPYRPPHLQYKRSAPGPTLARSPMGQPSAGPSQPLTLHLTEGPTLPLQGRPRPPHGTPKTPKPDTDAWVWAHLQQSACSPATEPPVTFSALPVVLASYLR